LGLQWALKLGALTSGAESFIFNFPTILRLSMGLAKDSLSEVIGLKNDIVYKVFTCPDCKAEVTISRYQTIGELPIMCARCNMRFQIKGEELRDLNKERDFGGFKVFMKTDASQKAAPVPKDSYIQFVKNGMKAAAPAAPAPKPAAVPVAPTEPPAV
jgi:DNA-directed RNA polymerase subunit RPC12/RpoP